MEWLVGHAEFARMNAPNQGLFPERILNLQSSPSGLPSGILALPIVSHLPTRLASREPWLTSLTEAISEVKNRGWRVMASVGLSCWEIPTRIAARLEVPLTLILPPSSDAPDAVAEEATRELNLHPSLISFISPMSPEKLTRKEALRTRDQLAGALAHVWLPIAIKPKGYWEGVIPYGARVDARFTSPYPEGVPIQDYRLQDESSESAGFPWENYLVHFTRGSYAPWPGERRADYYDALIDGSEHINPRDEAATLVAILKSGVLRGSDRMYRTQTPSISFTGLKPVDFIRGTSFRPSLHHRTAEAFGIAIPKKTLVTLGARPVIYGSPDDYLKLPASDLPFFQTSGSHPNNWTDENEWRLIGDLDIHSLGSSIVTLFPTSTQLNRIEDSVSGVVLPLFKESL